MGFAPASINNSSAGHAPFASGPGAQGEPMPAWLNLDTEIAQFGLGKDRCRLVRFRHMQRERQRQSDTHVLKPSASNA